jgi:2-succinyl-6-hydroxy-2,4-cyclohexadiene-1-carboxylate synthase
LFLHGFLGSHEDWQTVTNNLKDRFNCVTVDLPGHGSSVNMNADSYVFEQTAKLIVDSFLSEHPSHLVGYSLGGRLALYITAIFPEEVKSVTLLSASPGLITETECTERIQYDEAVAHRLETENIETFLRDWYNQPLFSSLMNNKPLLETTITRRKQHNPKEWAKALRGMSVGRQPSLWDQLPALSVSTLLLTGESDSKFVQIAKQMKTKNDNFRLNSIAQAGHALHLEQPVAVADSIRAFIVEQEKGI